MCAPVDFGAGSLEIIVDLVSPFVGLVWGQKVQPWVCEGEDAAVDTVLLHEGELGFYIGVGGVDRSSSLIDGDGGVVVG